MFTISVKATGDSTNRGPTFDGYTAGRQVVSRSTQPFLDGARVLLGEGADPDSRYAMRHDGSDIDALVSTIGYAARWTIEEGESPPRLRRHVPYDAMSRSRERPPMRFNEAPATLA
jgi:hypothetical protein